MAETMPEAARARFEDLRLSTYVTANDVQTVASDAKARARMLEVLAGLGISKVYVEVYRGGVVLSEADLVTVRDFLQDAGYAVTAGIATVPGGDFGVAANAGLGWFNFQAEKTQRDLEAVVRTSARVFDEFIVDDFLCTGDLSTESAAAKGPRSWGDYRRDLMVAVSEEVFLRPAREENPDITMIVKFPQWYDRFHLFGYDPERLPQQYDRVFVGTETRGANTQRFGFVQAYEGFNNYRWLAAQARGKIGGAWFDHGDCDGPDFVEQAYQSVLAGAQELVLFSYGQLEDGHPGHALLRDAFPDLADLARAVRQHPVEGVPAYKPANSDPGGDLYLLDMLGMLGLPLVPVATLPDTAGAVLLPTQAAHDTKIVPWITERIAAKRPTIVTAGLLAVLKDDALTKAAGLQGPVANRPEKAAHLVDASGGLVPVEHGLHLEDSALRADTAAVVLRARVGEREVPFLTRHVQDGATIYVLNTHTYSQADFDAVGEVLLAPRPLGLLALPEAWLHELRMAFDPAWPLVQAPARVTCQALGEDGWYVQNYTAADAAVSLRIDAPGKSVYEGHSGEMLGESPITLQHTLPARGRWWVRTR
jgi:hypothetical protein